MVSQASLFLFIDIWAIELEQQKPPQNGQILFQCAYWTMLNVAYRFGCEWGFSCVIMVYLWNIDMFLSY